jgi:L-2,4-diaminobutyric acid acetyltransferase
MADKHSKGNGGNKSAPALVIEEPSLADASALWRITRDSQVLDLNSSYAYLLWARDFAATSAVAKANDEVVGFVTGYVRPDAPNTLVVWQIAVDDGHRGSGLASALLHQLLDRVASRGVTYLETTITSDNEASIRLFSALAGARGTQLTSESLFGSHLFADGHEAEYLYRIGPLTPHRPRLREPISTGSRHDVAIDRR